MTILVTGSSGLVGTALKEFIKEDVVFASRIDADLTNFDQTIRLFQRVRPTKVIHLAALVGGIGGNMNFKGEFFYDNIMMNTNAILRMVRTRII